MKIVGVDREDWDKGKSSVELEVEYENSFSIGDTLRRNLLDTLIKEQDVILTQKRGDVHNYSLRPPIVLDYGYEDIAKVEKMLYEKYFNYKPSFDQYFQLLVACLCEFFDPDVEDYLDADLYQFNKKIFNEFDSLVEALSKKGVALEIVGCEQFNRRVKGLNKYCRISKGNRSRLLHVGPYTEGIQFQK